MKVFVVQSMGRIYGIYLTKESAEKAQKNADWESAMSGNKDIWGIEEVLVQE